LKVIKVIDQPKYFRKLPANQDHTLIRSGNW